MSGPSSQCPSCGASISFRWAGAVQTTCEYCDSILVRHGTDLEKVGRVSERPPTTSPVQLGTEGSYDGRRFMVVGRIVYGYERGGWSEWHLVFDDGSSGWLSDAMLEYSVSFLVEDAGPIPHEDQVRPGLRLKLLGDVFEVADATPARYLSTEGELPWEYHDRENLTFADLKASDSRIVTLDYSEDPPLVFAGRYVDFDDLRLENVREDAEEILGHSDGVRTLGCPNCGSSVEVRQAGISVNVVCESCASILDATSPGAEVLQTFARKARIEPRIPLGSKGRWKGDEYECLGFQLRTMHWPGERYSWGEYLLHNPEHGFRYLTEEDGHWNDAITAKSVPREVGGGGSHPKFEFRGEVYKHFEGARTTTDYVLGEWPWEVRVGDSVRTDDYVHPPRSLSREYSDDETVWSVAEYVDGHAVWDAFGLEGKPPRPRGVYSNQPSPHLDGAKRMGLTAGLVLPVFLALWFTRAVFVGSTPVMAESHRYEPPADSSSVVVLGPFRVEGRTSNVAVEARTDVSNNWIYFDYALMSTETGDATEFGREVGYYFGREGGESWSEGSQDDRALVPAVAAGEYMLRVAPEGPAPTQYTIRIVRDAPVTLFWIMTLVLLVLPPGFALLRHSTFKTRRWAESDYADDD